VTNRRRGALFAALVSAGAWIACAQFAAKNDARSQAESMGKYKVHLTTDRESVEGHCKFVKSILPDFDPIIVARPVDDQHLADYYRVEAVLLGADTVLVDGRTGEAYICGPLPLNPDGSLQSFAPPATPGPKPEKK